ncbi:MAG TPA: RHS repeat-associated core domain-containing protein [Thermoanaerobaculia bacterium]|nr:RHS repeat-associated core domain-containing protein [Thermoanaerobaculia bacterium]
MRTILHGLLMTAFATLWCVALSAQSDIEVGSYTYDHSGNVISIRVPDVLTSTYQYDAANRVIRFTETDTSGAVVRDETFEYDGYGNQTAHSAGGSRNATPAAAATNRLSDATYDAVGNLTQYQTESYGFDPAGTMTTRTGSHGTTFYIYTADDERIGIGVGGPSGTWRYMGRDLGGKVLREWTGAAGSSAWAWIEDYVYRGGELAAAERPAAQGGIRHFHLDHQGTPRVISGHNKAIYAEHRYAPFGVEITDPAQELARGHDTPEPMKFTGHERDLTGPDFDGPALDYMHARYYGPAFGRFVSPDPGRDWDLAVPQSWNLYSYVRNNPINFTDRTGRAVFENAERLKAAGDDVISRPNLQPSRDAQGAVTQTYCNFGVREILQEGGDHTVDGMTARQMTEFLSDPKNATELSYGEAVEYAKEGATVIMAEPGHVAVVSPQEMAKAGKKWDGKEVPFVFNVGQENGTKRLNWAFSAKKKPKAYILNKDKSKVDKKKAAKKTS